MELTYKMTDMSGGALLGLTPTVTIGGMAATGITTEIGSGWYRYTLAAGEEADSVVVGITATLAVPIEAVLTRQVLTPASRVKLSSDQPDYAPTTWHDVEPLATHADITAASATVQASATAALTAQGITPERVGKADMLPDTVVASKVDVDAATAAINAKPVTPAAPTVSDIVQGINAGGEGLASITEATIPDGDTVAIGGIKVGGVLTAGVLVEALKPDGSLADSTRTDGDGGFKLLVPTGATYTVRFSISRADAVSVEVTV